MVVAILGACRPDVGPTPGSLPACFTISADPWSEPPDSGYEFQPVRLILGSDPLYSDFFGEVIGRVAVIVDTEHGSSVVGWVVDEERRIETIPLIPGFGGTKLTRTGNGDGTWSGELEWFSDYGTGGRTSAEVSASLCSPSDRTAVLGHPNSA